MELFFFVKKSNFVEYFAKNVEIRPFSPF